MRQPQFDTPQVECSRERRKSGGKSWSSGRINGPRILALQITRREGRGR